MVIVHEADNASIAAEVGAIGVKTGKSTTVVTVRIVFAPTVVRAVVKLVIRNVAPHVLERMECTSVTDVIEIAATIVWWRNVNVTTLSTALGV